jgi:hypothetical protein
MVVEALEGKVVFLEGSTGICGIFERPEASVRKNWGSCEVWKKIRQFWWIKRGNQGGEENTLTAHLEASSGVAGMADSGGKQWWHSWVQAAQGRRKGQQVGSAR